MTENGITPDHQAVGVGMGGSCPSCSAPVALGQEFCLECGASIKAGRLKRARKKAPGPLASNQALAGIEETAKPKFPWIPFLIVLALVIAGSIVFLVNAYSSSEKDSSSKSKKEDTEVTGLSTAASTSTTQTVTVADCSTATSTTPPVATDTTATPGVTPSVGSFGSATPSTATPTPPAASTSGSTITVDGSGNLCPAAGSTPTDTTSGVPTLSTATTPTSSTSSTTDTSGDSDYTGSGDGKAQTWPTGTSGYSIVLGSYSQKTYSKNDAQNRAVQAQAKGVSSGVLDSNNFSSLTANLWVVFSGIYDSEDEADDELSGVRSKGYQGAYVRRIAQ